MENKITLRIQQIQIPIKHTDLMVSNAIAAKLGCSKKDVMQWKKLSQSIDARGQRLYRVISVACEVRDAKRFINRPDVSVYQPLTFTPPVQGTTELTQRPIIVGMGPAGLFCALLLSEMGYQPLVLEQGQPVEQRSKDVAKFWKDGTLDLQSNVQFGEGGAGTFSDGKLTSRSKDPLNQYVLDQLIALGADEAIAYEKYPHLGSDQLIKLLIALRKKLLSRGCELQYGVKVESLIMEQGQIKGVVANGQSMTSPVVILAIGHSSRQLVKTLNTQQVAMEKKAVAIGLRIEQLQSIINDIQYHGQWEDGLPAANYQVKAGSLYSFCMCPGGEVINAASEADSLTTNGMSFSHRKGINANSALIQQIDLPGDLMSNMTFLENLERQAYILGGNNHAAPVQLVKDYLANQPSTKVGNVKPSFTNGYRLCDLHPLFDDQQNAVFHEGLTTLMRQIPGFIDDSTILTGVETRVTSPIRILRDNQTLESINTKGLYPCGEGAGYAGGIMSSAIDGLKVAQAVISAYAPTKLK